MSDILDDRTKCQIKDFWKGPRADFSDVLLSRIQVLETENEVMKQYFEERLNELESRLRAYESSDNSKVEVLTERVNELADRLDKLEASFERMWVREKEAVTRLAEIESALNAEGPEGERFCSTCLFWDGSGCNNQGCRWPYTAWKPKREAKKDPKRERLEREIITAASHCAAIWEGLIGKTQKQEEAFAPWEREIIDTMRALSAYEKEK